MTYQELLNLVKKDSNVKEAHMVSMYGDHKVIIIATHKGLPEFKIPRGWHLESSGKHRYTLFQSK